MAVDRHALRQLRAGQFGERREEVAEVDQVAADLARGRRAGPVGDQRHAAAAFQHRALLAGEPLAVHGCAVGPAGGGAVVAGEDDERLLAQLQPVEFGDELADQLVHVGDVVGVEVAGRRCCRACAGSARGCGTWQ